MTNWADTSRKPFPYKGEQLTLSEIAKREGVAPVAIHHRWLRSKRTEKAPKQPKPLKLYEYNGEHRTLADIAAAEGINKGAVWYRLSTTGTMKTKTELGQRWRLFDYHGEQLTIPQIAKREGVTRQAINERISRFGSVHKLQKQPQAHEEKAKEPARSRKPYTCRSCNQPGHSVQSCWYRRKATPVASDSAPAT